MTWLFPPQRWHPAGGRFGDGLRLADPTLRQRNYDGEMLPVEEMPEIWQTIRQLSKANRPTDVNCTGICFVHLIFVYIYIYIHIEVCLCVVILNPVPLWEQFPFQTWRCWGWGAERSWGCLDLSRIGSQWISLQCGTRKLYRYTVIPLQVWNLHKLLGPRYPNNTNSRERYPNSSWCGYDGYIYIYTLNKWSS